MGDSMEDILSVTMKRLEIVMRNPAAALKNRAEQFVGATLTILQLTEIECGILEAERKTLYGYAKDLYIQAIRNMPHVEGKNCYQNINEVLAVFLLARNLMDHRF